MHLRFLYYLSFLIHCSRLQVGLFHPLQLRKAHVKEAALQDRLRENNIQLQVSLDSCHFIDETDMTDVRYFFLYFRSQLLELDLLLRMSNCLVDSVRDKQY